MASPSVLPRIQRAVVITADENITVWDEAPCPKAGPDQLTIRTEAVAINPSDSKMRGAFITPMGILGTDYAGTVLAVGSEIRNVKVGDRVAGAQNAMRADTPERGSFCQFNLTAGQIWLKLPDTISTEAGASFGAGISTAGIAIRLLGLPLPSSPAAKAETVLVYGGSTATGTIAMQLLKLANLIPIATCSPKNNDLVKSYGAEEVFDYRDKDCSAHIRAYTKNNLRYALDCITTVESTSACFAAIGRAGGKYVSLDPFATQAASRKTVKTNWVLGPSIFGDGSTWPAPYGRDPDEGLRAYGAELFAVAQTLLNEGKLRNHPLHVIEGGIDAITEGIETVRSGRMSGQKLVIKLT